MKSYFAMSAAADHQIRHPFSDLKLLEAELDEMEARHAAWSSSAAHTPVPTATLDHDGIWAKTNGKTKAELVSPKASSTTLDVEEIWRRFNGGGPAPERVLVSE